MNQRQIFDAALDIADPAERARFLEQACTGDAALQKNLEDLLAIQTQLGSFLETPAQVLAAAAADCLAAQSGTVIGPYKLLQQIGEGGMGAVYMAEQSRPVQRKVALKIIKPGMDSRQVIARFEAERQALAMMDHPNIARVLDAGTVGAPGRPYFVMELVKGIPITAYCDAQRLSPAARLRLLLTVCHAVQHAHQKGIIHRDLKPSNVLVAEYDETPVAKVIDFGVAKATGPKLTERTLFTEFGQIIGTVEYMSPEQAKFNALDIDTRSDIYALGVLLYELLTGTTPLPQARLRQTPFDEALRLIREEEPPLPSHRLSTLAELATVAINRGVEPRRLSGLVRGELDWIVMKCLEKDRDRRYETASALALDIEHYLNDEPVAACPPSRGYRIRKFVRRHKGPVLAASSMLLLLVAGIFGTTWGLVQAQQARDDAELAAQAEAAQKRVALANATKARAAADAEKIAKETAQARDAETHAVLDFVDTRVFAAARPKNEDGGLGAEVSLRDAVEAALPVLANSFTDQPLIEARLRITLGNSFWYLGDAKLAAEQFQAARAIYRKKLGPDHPDTLTSMMGLANCYAALGRPDDAVKLHEETLALRKARLGPYHRATLTSMHNLASSYEVAGRRSEALKLREKTWTLRRDKLGPDDPQTLASMNNLAGSYFVHGRHDDALKLYKKVLELRTARLGPDHPDTLRSMNNLANAYGALDRRGDALKLRLKAVALHKEKLGSKHPDTLAAMGNLATSFAAVGRHKDALKLRAETLALQKERLGPIHPDTLRSMNNLATSYTALGQYADALALHEQTLALRKGRLGPDHPDTLLSMGNVAVSLAQAGRPAEAIPMIDDCVRRAAGKVVAPGMLAGLLNLRLRHFQHHRDAAGCRASAEMWEKLARRDAASLYDAACFRAVTAQVFRATDAKQANAEANCAMMWLRQAVAAGYANVARLIADRDLAVLRGRADFQELLAELSPHAPHQSK